MKTKEYKKLNKRLKKVAYMLLDEIWLATHPPLFKQGDIVKWYENPTSTNEPGNEPEPISVVIQTSGDVHFCSRKKEYYSPYRTCLVSSNEKPLFEVYENSCTK